MEAADRIDESGGPSDDLSPARSLMPTAAAIAAGFPGGRRDFTQSAIAIIAGAVLGPLLIYVGLGVLTSVTAEIRIGFVLLGLTGVLIALSGLIKRRSPRAKPGVWFATAWLSAVVISAVFADLLPLAESRDASKTFQEPVLATPDLLSRHPLGTDRQGLDILGGIIYGFRVSLVVGLGTVAIGVVLGGLIGMAAGYHRRRVDRIVGFLTNSMLAFPPLILLLAVAAVMERNVRNMTLALALVTIPIYVRLARANTLTVMQRDFVLSARSLGAKSRHIILRDVMPMVVRPMLSYAFVIVASIIVAEASLSFLGLGIPRPEPTLGNMISAGQADFQRYPHLVFAPSIALFLTVLALNRVGEEAQRRLSGREAKI